MNRSSQAFRKTVRLLVFTAIAVPTAALSNAYAQAIVTLTRLVVSAGAVAATGEAVQIQGTIGQPLAGTATTPSRNAHQGFWFTSDLFTTGIEPVFDVLPVPSHDEIVAYPNPFSGAVDIVFQAEPGASAQLSVYDAAGRLVTGLDRSWGPSGYQTFRWDGRDNSGNKAPSGTYRLVAHVFNARSSPTPAQNESYLVKTIVLAR